MQTKHSISEVTVLDLFSPNQVTRNASVRLLDSGNLVVQELYPDGSIKEVLWQSFDYPTDTLLPGMKLGTNLKTGHRWSLTSWRNNELPADGSFTLTGDLNGTGQMVILRQKNVHWKSGPWRNGNGVGCKTYGKRIYNPDKADKERYYSTIEHNLGSLIYLSTDLKLDRKNRTELCS
ncbi:G-type lectin S-receptor-like serine/threonine-protein kinase CES101 [Tanacetum coccineum]